MDVLADGWQAASLEQFLGHGPDGHEEVELFSGAPGGGLIFGCRHMPAAGSSTAGVVICAPTHSDAGINYHREARLGRWLARAGVATQRFHYRGTGDSDRLPSPGITFQTLVDDARQAADLLRERCGVERVGFLGTRVGALVAAKAAAEVEGAPLALWQPVIDPRRYVNDSVAVDFGRGALGPATLPTGFDGPDSDLGPHGPGAPPIGGVPLSTPGARSTLVDSPLGRDLFDPSVIDNLVDAIGRRPRPVLVVQLHRRVGLAPDYRAAVGRWQARGFPVDVAYDPTEDEWWQVHQGWEPSDEVLSATSSWLSARLAPRPGDPWPGAAGMPGAPGTPGMPGADGTAGT